MRTSILHQQQAEFKSHPTPSPRAGRHLRILPSRNERRADGLRAKIDAEATHFDYSAAILTLEIGPQQCHIYEAESYLKHALSVLERRIRRRNPDAPIRFMVEHTVKGWPHIHAMGRYADLAPAVKDWDEIVDGRGSAKLTRKASRSDAIRYITKFYEDRDGPVGRRTSATKPVNEWHRGQKLSGGNMVELNAHKNGHAEHENSFLARAHDNSMAALKAATASPPTTVSDDRGDRNKLLSSHEEFLAETKKIAIAKGIDPDLPWEDLLRACISSKNRKPDMRSDEEKLHDDVLMRVRARFIQPVPPPDLEEKSPQGKEWPPCPEPEQYKFIGGLATRYGLEHAQDFVRRHLS